MGSSVDIFCVFCLWIATCEKKDASTTLIRYNLVSLIEALDSAYKKTHPQTVARQPVVWIL